MNIKVEPTDFFMYSVKLIYDLESPDSEDQQIRDYLIEHELEPKYQGTGDYESRHSEIMYFGGCYLGKHLQRIGEIQRHAVEGEILAEEIERHLKSAIDSPLPVAGKGREGTVAHLVQEFRKDSSFQTNENGELCISLDENEVVTAARRFVNDSQNS